MSQAHYGIAPSINLSRTLMRTKYDLETTFLHGKLIPLDMIPVLPGSSFKVDLTSYIRMSDPIVPIFGNVTVGIHAFFVPWRLLWEHTEEFFGANKTSKGPQTTVYKIPKVKVTDVGPQSVGDYLGFPLTAINTTAEAAASSYSVNALKFRAYMLIWNEWYRSTQLSNPFIIDLGDTNTTVGEETYLGSRNGDAVESSMDPIEVCKKFDVFTAATLSPQYGDAVEISFGEDAVCPVEFVGSEKFGDLVSDLMDTEGVTYVQGPNFQNLDGETIGIGDGDATVNGFYGTNDGVNYAGIFDSDESYAIDNPAKFNAYDPKGKLAESTLVAKLDKVLMTDVRQLRFSFALQRYLELLNYGSRYFEILRNVYGTTNPDARLQRPEHIGQIHFPIQIQQVLSTAGAETGVTSKLGQAGANSVTLNRSVLTSKGFTEFGYLCIMLDTKHDRVYSQGLRREDWVDDRFDIYAPQFDHIGDFGITKQEVMITNANAGKSDSYFGYQEGWFNERYRDSRVSGRINPNIASPIAPYSLAETFDGGPELNENFILEDRNNIARVLKTGDTGPDYLANFHIELRMVKPMSAHSLPGLIDHVGRM